MSMANCEPQSGEQSEGATGQTLSNVEIQKITIITSSENRMGGVN